MTASSSMRRKRRGCGLPACGRGVTVPHSTKPNPASNIASGTSQSLSNPAARPTGLGSCRPPTSVFKISEVITPPFGPRPARSNFTVVTWARSVGRRRRRDVPILYIRLIVKSLLVSSLSNPQAAYRRLLRARPPRLAPQLSSVNPQRDAETPPRRARLHISGQRQ